VPGGVRRDLAPDQRRYVQQRGDLARSFPPPASYRVASRRADPGWFLSGACTAATAVPGRPSRPIDRCPCVASPRGPEALVSRLRPGFDPILRSRDFASTTLVPLPPPPPSSFVCERTKRARCALVEEPDLRGPATCRRRARCNSGSRGYRLIAAVN